MYTFEYINNFRCFIPFQIFIIKSKNYGKD